MFKEMLGRLGRSWTRAAGMCLVAAMATAGMATNGFAVSGLEDGIIETIYYSIDERGYSHPMRSVACDSKDNIYFVEDYVSRILVKRIDAETGEVTVYAGNLFVPADVRECVGDGGPATEAGLYWARGIAFDSKDNLYIVDSGHNRVRVVDAEPPHIIRTYAGNGAMVPQAFGGVTDGQPATESAIGRGPISIAIDKNDDVYIGTYCEILKVDHVDETIYNFAGRWSTKQSILMRDTVFGIEFDSENNLYISSTLQNVILRVDHNTGIINTFAGNGLSTLGSDNVPATQTSILYPRGLAIDDEDNVYVALPTNHWCIKRIDAKTGIMTTIAGQPGDMTSAFGGDGGPAKLSRLVPMDICFDSKGNMYIADISNNRIRKISNPCVLPQVDLTNAEPAGDYEVELGWTADPSTGCKDVESFVISRDGVELATVGGDVHTFTDTVPNDCAEYCYTVSAVAGDESTTSNEKCVYMPDVTPPECPANFTAVAISGTEIALKWDAAIDECDGTAAGYVVTLPDGSTVDTADTSLAIPGLEECNEYCFAITAYDSSGNTSGACAQVCARTPFVIDTGGGSMEGKCGGTYNVNSAVVIQFTLTKDGAPVTDADIADSVPVLYYMSADPPIVVTPRVVGSDGLFKYVGGGVWQINIKSCGENDKNCDGDELAPGEYMITAEPNPAWNNLCEGGELVFEPRPSCNFTLIEQGGNGRGR